MWSGRPNGALVAEVAGLAPGRVLDVGCGEGADAIWLAGLDWDVTALDVSGVALDRAAQHARDAGVTSPGSARVWRPRGSRQRLRPGRLHTPRDGRRAAGRRRHIEVDEQRPRGVPENGAGAHHVDAQVLRARRLR